MTVCNMSIEWGAKAGLIAPRPDDLRLHRGPGRGAEGRRLGRRGRALEDPRHGRRRALRQGDRARCLDDDAVRHLGHQPGSGRPARRERSGPGRLRGRGRSHRARRPCSRGPGAGIPLREVKVDTVFVGSCTNGRIEDLRAAAAIIDGRHVDKDTRLLVVPGSVRVRLQAEEEGLDVIFKEAGAEWRGAGCSMCLGMNPDQAHAGGAQRPRPTATSRVGRARAVCPPGVGAGRRGHRDPRHPLVPRRPEGPLTMEKFISHTGVGVPLRRSNVDTDQIIPAVYLKRVTRTASRTGCSPRGATTPTSC